MMVSDSGSPLMLTGWSSGSSSSMSRAGSGSEEIWPIFSRCWSNSASVIFFFAGAALVRPAALAGSRSQRVRLDELAVELLAKPPHLLRRKGLEAAQDVVEIGLRHTSIPLLSGCV